MEAGERVESIEVLRIDREKAEVTLRDAKAGTTNVLALTPSSEVPARTLLLVNASSIQALDVYQTLSGRTVIREPALPVTRINLETDANLTDEQAGQQLGQALAAAGIAMVARGEKYVFAVRDTETNRLATIPDPPANAPTTPANATAEDQVVFGPGMLRLADADTAQVLAIYQDLSGRTILRPNHSLDPRLTVHSQTALTRREAQWLLGALFQLGGVDIVLEGSKFAFAIPSSHPLRSQLPKFDETAASFKVGRTGPPGTLKCDSVPAAQFLGMYAGLTGRQTATTTNPSSARFTIRSQSDLSRAEAVFAMEALALINGLRLELIGENGVQIVPAAQAMPPFRRPTQ